ncbi:MAG: hypothetical protein C5S49_04020 [Candidatus Methanogaster sp.]|nr:MAG: hypothetical protein C5S49_04020 [ANME-2 cluster archaeon]
MKLLKYKEDRISETYGLYDLAGLEKIILENIAGDFFDLS